jgi:hypothetical protein
MYNIMEGLDLNIDNYDLNDLLELFRLEFDFKEDDLKRVKKSVMQTHPDKSGLDKKYFLFFTSAYKIIFSIYDFRYKSSKNQSTEYIVEKDEEKELLLKEIKSKSNFNKIFNELFEKHRITNENEANGYGDWLKSNEGIDTRTTTMNQMNETFENKKKEIQAIIPLREVEDIGQSAGHYDLTCDKPDYYSSDVFGKLQYDDLKRAHVESVIPITHDDYLKRPKFKNVLEYQQQAEYKDTTPISLSQSTEYFKQRQSFQTKNDVQRAYKLARQEEVARKTNLNLMSGFKQLTN